MKIKYPEIDDGNNYRFTLNQVKEKNKKNYIYFI